MQRAHVWLVVTSSVALATAALVGSCAVDRAPPPPPCAFEDCGAVGPVTPGVGADGAIVGQEAETPIEDANVLEDVLGPIDATLDFGADTFPSTLDVAPVPVFDTRPDEVIRPL